MSDCKGQRINKKGNTNTEKKQRNSLIGNGTILMKQLQSVLKIRLSIANISFSEDKINERIRNYINQIHFDDISIHSLNKMVEEIYDLFLCEIKQETTLSCLIDSTSTFESITFNPSNNEVKWEIDPILMKTPNLSTDSNINSIKQKKKQSVKRNIPMKFSKGKERSIPEAVFFLDYNYGKINRKQCQTQYNVHDIDINAMNERIIDQIMNKASS